MSVFATGVSAAVVSTEMLAPITDTLTQNVTTLLPVGITIMGIN